MRQNSEKYLKKTFEHDAVNRQLELHLCERVDKTRKRVYMNWTLLAPRPPVWHAASCLPEAVAERLLTLSNATANADDAGASPGGAAILHQIVDQGDPAVRFVRSTMASRAGLAELHAEPLFVLEYRSGMRCNIGQAMPHHDWNCASGSPDNPEDEAIGCPQVRTSPANMSSEGIG